jgi:hypothetical protein
MQVFRIYFHMTLFSILVINCVRILTRLLPYIFEDPDWRSFFWSSLPSSSKQQFKDDGENPEGHAEESVPLAQSLLNALCDLLFCPDFTVYSSKKFGPVSFIHDIKFRFLFCNLNLSCRTNMKISIQ